MILETTTVTVRRVPAKVDGQDPVLAQQVVTRVPARVSSIDGRRDLTKESATAVLYVDYGVDLRRQDQVTDDVTGDVWDVTWTRAHVGLGLDYLAARLERSKGSA